MTKRDILAELDRALAESDEMRRRYRIARVEDLVWNPTQFANMDPSYQLEHGGYCDAEIEDDADRKCQRLFDVQHIARGSRRPSYVGQHYLSMVMDEPMSTGESLDLQAAATSTQDGRRSTMHWRPMVSAAGVTGVTYVSYKWDDVADLYEDL